MTNKQFEKYLKSIGGLENGYATCPPKNLNPVKYRLFMAMRKLGYEDKKIRLD